LAKQDWKIAIWGTLAYFLSFINDPPLNADTLLGHHGYFFMEVLLNLLSLSCFCLASREAIKGRSIPGPPLKVALCTVLAFVLSSADDIPFLASGLHLPRTEFWFQFDIAIYGVSLVFFYLAVRQTNVSITTSLGRGQVPSKALARPGAIFPASLLPRNGSLACHTLHYIFRRI
jgi:hypothetical protein